MTARQLVLALALVVTLAATWWASRLDGEGDAQSGPQPAAARLPETDQRVETERRVVATPDDFAIRRPPWPEYSEAMMRTLQFAPLVPVTAHRNPAPSAPPLPFRYAGRIEDSRGEAVFLLDGSRVRMARPGELLDGRYRLERISARGIEFTFLPLNMKQTLSRQNP